MMWRRSLCGILFGVTGLLSVSPIALAESDLHAAFARTFPGYEVLTLDDLDPEIADVFRSQPDGLPYGHTPAWAPGDYDGDGHMDVAVLAKKRVRGDTCDKGLFAIISAAGHILHSSGDRCVSSSDVIVYHPPGHTVEYLTDRYDMPDATDEEMFAKKTLPFASVEHITWGTAAGLYHWNPATRRMESNTTAD